MVKGKETARMIPVNADGRQAITELIQRHKEQFSELDPRRPLFTSRKQNALCLGLTTDSISRCVEEHKAQTKAISRVQAHRILEKAFQTAGLNGKLATHSMRKTYAQRLYDATGDIFMVKEALGHKSVETTKQYLGVSYSKMQAASKAIELSSNKRTVLLHSIDEIATAELIAELISRGVDMESAIQQMKAERQPAEWNAVPSSAKSDKVIRYPIQAERLYGTG